MGGRHGGGGRDVPVNRPLHLSGADEHYLRPRSDRPTGPDRRPAGAAAAGRQRSGDRRRRHSAAGAGGARPGGGAPPRTETVDRAAAIYRRGDGDCLVAVGGGSAMDVAKVVAVLVTHGGGVLEYEGIGKVPGPTVPVVCLPTTAGTGSEVTQFTVITDRGRPFKLTVGSPYVVPTAAVCDPNLTLSMPQPLTAATGMDALTHGIECYINTVTNPLAKTYPLAAIRLIGRYLRTAYATGKHLEARYHMLLASTLAAMAFGRPAGGANRGVPPFRKGLNPDGRLGAFPEYRRAAGRAGDGPAAARGGG